MAEWMHGQSILKELVDEFILLHADADKGIEEELRARDIHNYRETARER